MVSSQNFISHSPSTAGRYIHETVVAVAVACNCSFSVMSTAHGEFNPTPIEVERPNTFTQCWLVSYSCPRKYVKPSIQKQMGKSLQWLSQLGNRNKEKQSLIRSQDRKVEVASWQSPVLARSDTPSCPEYVCLPTRCHSCCGTCIAPEKCQGHEGGSKIAISKWGR